MDDLPVLEIETRLVGIEMKAKRKEKQKPQHQARPPDYIAERVFVYFNPLKQPDRIPAFINFNDLTHVLAPLKPLSDDLVSTKGNKGWMFARANQPNVVYLDEYFGPYLIHGHIPYPLLVADQDNQSGTFWQAIASANQPVEQKELLVDLMETFGQASLKDREIEMVKKAFSLPAATPSSEETENEGYDRIFHHELSGMGEEPEHPALSQEECAPHNGNRYDLRNHLIFTIDSETTKDIDDAIEIMKLDEDTYVLGVHIADVTAFVEEGGKRDLDAGKRATSFYLADRVIHMLPEILSEDLCSLKAGRDRLTLSFYARVTRTVSGILINDIRFAKSVINSRHKLSYNEVNRILKSDPKSTTGLLEETLRAVLELKTWLEDHLLPHRIEQEQHKENAEGLIETLMLTANLEVGRRLADILASLSPHPGGCVLYRVQEAPREDDLRNYMERLRTYGFIDRNITYQLLSDKSKHLFSKISGALGRLSGRDKKVVKRSCIYRALLEKIEVRNEDDFIRLAALGMIGTRPGFINQSAQLSDNLMRGFHHSLGLHRYAWFTSPIRRYPDMINHRALKNVIQEHPLVSSEIDPVATARQIKKQKDASKAIKRRLDFYSLCQDGYLTAFKHLDVQVTGFRWLNSRDLIFTAKWKKMFPLTFLFKTTPRAEIIKHGLECRFDNGLVVEVADTIRVTPADPLRDVNPDMGCILLDGPERIGLVEV